MLFYCFLFIPNFSFVSFIIIELQIFLISAYLMHSQIFIIYVVFSVFVHLQHALFFLTFFFVSFHTSTIDFVKATWQRNLHIEIFYPSFIVINHYFMVKHIICPKYLNLYLLCFKIFIHQTIDLNEVVNWQPVLL